MQLEIKKRIKLYFIRLIAKIRKRWQTKFQFALITNGDYKWRLQMEIILARDRCCTHAHTCNITCA